MLSFLLLLFFEEKGRFVGHHSLLEADEAAEDKEARLHTTAATETETEAPSYETEAPSFETEAPSYETESPTVLSEDDFGFH